MFPWHFLFAHTCSCCQRTLEAWGSLAYQVAKAVRHSALRFLTTLLLKHGLLLLSFPTPMSRPLMNRMRAL